MSLPFSKNKKDMVRLFNPRASHFKMLPKESRGEFGDTVAQVLVPEDYRDTFIQAPNPGKYYTSTSIAKILEEKYPGIEGLDWSVK